MPYALFSNGEKISQIFPTADAVWRHADEAGLVVDGSVQENKNPEQILDEGYTIKRCEPDAADTSAEKTGNGSSIGA